jgi:hypothetical protein
MTLFITKFKKYFIYGLFSLFALLVFFGWYYEVKADLLKDMTEPARDANQVIYLWDSVTSAWKRVIENKDSVIVRATRLLLILTIALSVTMILYNGMQYIIETWQGKEWKSLAKNVVLIIVWILIALFSSIIITLIQSVPESTLGETVGSEDKSVL